MKFIPTEILIVKGKGESDTSKSNAWDRALQDAGIANCNINEYSSILPRNFKLRDFRKELVHGQELNAALSVSHGKKRNKISAGIVYGSVGDYGLINEFNEKSDMPIKKILIDSIEELAKDRKLELKDIRTEIENIEVKKNYGCVLVAIIFNPNTYV